MMNSFLPTPPIYEQLATPDNRITDIWKNHLDSISQTLGLVLLQDRFNDTKQEASISMVISMQRPRINQLENTPNGTILYDLTNNYFIFRQAGAWVTFTPIPA